MAGGLDGAGRFFGGRCGRLVSWTSARAKPHQLGPDARPILRAQFLPRHAALRGYLDGRAVLDGHLAFAAGPLADQNGVHTDGPRQLRTTATGN